MTTTTLHDERLSSRPYVLTGLAVLTAVMFIWPIQGTIALRNALLFFALIWVVVGMRRLPSDVRWSIGVPRVVWWIFGLLTAWMLIQVMGWALAPEKVLNEIRGRWLLNVIVFFIGVSAARLLPDHRQTLLRLLFAVLAVNVWFIVAVDLVHWMQHGTLMRRFGGLEGTNFLEVTGSPDKANYLTNMYLALLFAEVIMKRLGREGALGLGYPAIGLLFAGGLFSSYIEDMRNGTVLLGLMTVLSIGVLISQSPPARRRREIAVALLVGVVGIGFVGYTLSHQQRWKTLLATVPIALDTTHNREWLTGGLPKFPDGQVVNVSNYQRIAWAKEGLHVIWRYPLGVGFQGQAFGYGVDAIYHTDLARGNHSHSGIIDFTDGVGLPGLALWLIFITTLFRSAWRGLATHRVAAAAALGMVVFDYFTRSLVDSIMRDHMWEMFMFMSGFLLSWAMLDQRRSLSDTA
ncbi:hypothetical protein [Acidihalobacter prosperus]|uniref:hypothetical protein n=1 Tax=Acidihalobacter prosperus TaxID=160660 RepID=UPI000505073C|nr:hypothetical protein [Acidihalobacter prosperus]